MLLDHDAMTFTSYDEAHNEASDFTDEATVAARLTEAAVPVMAILGSEDQIVDNEPTAAAYGGVPGAEVQLIDGVGHSAQLEDPEKTAELILRFAEDAPAPGRARAGPEAEGQGREEAEGEQGEDLGRQGERPEGKARRTRSPRRRAPTSGSGRRPWPRRRGARDRRTRRRSGARPCGGRARCARRRARPRTRSSAPPPPGLPRRRRASAQRAPLISHGITCSSLQKAAACPVAVPASRKPSSSGTSTPHQVQTGFAGAAGFHAHDDDGQG